MKHFLLLPLLMISVTLHGQTWSETQKVVPDDRDNNDEFGNAVAIDGDYAIVGAKREDHDANGMNDAADAGSAYILKRTAGVWSQEAKLVAGDRESQDWFGHRVDISGMYAIAGAPFESSPAGAGAAYIFETTGNGTWVQAAKLEAPIRKSSDYFGFSVGISGDWAVCGAYYEDEDENEANEILSAGSAYIFKRDNGQNTWDFYQKIVASDRELDARFGMSVAIDGDQIIVGSEFDDVDLPSNGYQSNAGSAYVFRLNGGTWEQEAHLTASDYGSSENFGWAVDVSGDYAVVGAYRNDTDEDGLNSSPDAGAAYVFERGSGAWPQVAKIVGSDRANIDYFGYDVSVDGETVAVGAYRQDRNFEGQENWTDAGAVYVYDRNSSGEWLQTQKITHTERKTLDQLGWSVDIDGDEIIAGANMEDEDENEDNPLPEAGSVYLFSNSTTAVSEIDQLDVNFYPNPTDGIIQLSSRELIETVQVFSVDGKSVFQLSNINRTSAQIDLSKLEAGFYVVRVNEVGTSTLVVK